MANIKYNLFFLNLLFLIILNTTIVFSNINAIEEEMKIIVIDENSTPISNVKVTIREINFMNNINMYSKFPFEAETNSEGILYKSKVSIPKLDGLYEFEIYHPAKNIYEKNIMFIDSKQNEVLLLSEYNDLYYKKILPTEDILSKKDNFIKKKYATLYKVIDSNGIAVPNAEIEFYSPNDYNYNPDSFFISNSLGKTDSEGYALEYKSVPNYKNSKNLYFVNYEINNKKYSETFYFSPKINYSKINLTKDEIKNNVQVQDEIIFKLSKTKNIESLVKHNDTYLSNDIHDKYKYNCLKELNAYDKYSKLLKIHKYGINFEIINDNEKNVSNNFEIEIINKSYLPFRGEQMMCLSPYEYKEETNSFILGKTNHDGTLNSYFFLPPQVNEFMEKNKAYTIKITNIDSKKEKFLDFIPNNNNFQKIKIKF